MSLKIITDPDEFFGSKAADTSFAGPILVLCLAALANVSSQLGLLYSLVPTAPEGTKTILLVSGLVGVLLGGLVMFGLWLLYSLVLHALSVRLGGTGSLRDTALLSGWGFIPNIVSGAFSGFVTYHVVGDTLAGTDLQSASIQTLPGALQSHPLLKVTTAVTITVLLWRGLIWTFVVRHAHDLQLKRSALVAAVPTIGAILLTILS